MQVCCVCQRRAKRRIVVREKVLCTWCEQAMMMVSVEDPEYGEWMRRFRPAQRL